MSRAAINPILHAIPAARQEGARHYGVHPYFTRRPANVVRAYVERYSRVGDTVLDPFGGTGVTAIEAFLMGRRAIQNDLNPFANFIARNIADTRLSSVQPLRDALHRIQDECKTTIHEIEADEKTAKQWLNKVVLPANIRLPRNSDAECFFDLFTPRQLAGLALLKEAIARETDDCVRDLLLLAWSASVAKLNKTFLSAKGRAASRGGSSIFSIYRYKLASQYVELPIWDTFYGRVANVIAAKQEVFQCRNYLRQTSGGGDEIDSTQLFKVLACDAAALNQVIGPESVDYIFTDPPYGAFISYLDLSILWNHWLGFSVSTEAHEKETIVGGELGHTEEHYKASLAASIETCLSVLKPDRWFSIVFQHWDASYFSTILDTASSCGAELKSAITQTGDVIWSMHKKKNSASVLAGEMIITFYKPNKARPIKSAKATKHQDPEKILSEVFDACVNNGTATFTSETLFNRLVMEFWKRGALECLSLDRKEFVRQLENRGWHYNSQQHLWSKGSDMNSRPHAPILFDMKD